jgi:hypothetical protein
MDAALRDTERTVAVLSQDYLNAVFTHPEWGASFAQDPMSDKGKLLPVRVQECDLRGLFNQIIYIDLIGKDEEEARNDLISGVQLERAKPLTQPGFPGGTSRSVTIPPSFPGASRKRASTKPLITLAILFMIVGVYLAWSQPFSDWLRSPHPCPKPMVGESQYYEAEQADISGGAAKDSEHLGFSGDGFVSGYGIQAEAATTFSVEVPSDGQYQVDLCYANATNSAKTLTILVNDVPLKQTHLPNASRWNIWLTQSEFLPLRAGRNTISYQKTSNDNGQVNLDFIRIMRQPTLSTLPQPTSSLPLPLPTATPPQEPHLRRQKAPKHRSIRCSAEDRLFGRC